ncbi:hypothetical protein [Bacillus cytotoxicus]|nr:hypothetical protein [Bacillus cytotoxicus]QTR80535.1 hypothetical protein JC773_08915 [Bacillus cytotoxicus]HDR7309096.1 hypothetical protein [Bacillus cytotoxicus]HDR7864322.1 hypothetical protein [Bacillus cytotoxicus]
MSKMIFNERQKKQLEKNENVVKGSEHMEREQNDEKDYELIQEIFY